MLRAFVKCSIVLISISVVLFAGCSSVQGTRPDTVSPLVNVDTVRAGQFDTGKMWTFDYPPLNYFKKTYNFSPDQSWFEKARLGALRLPGCSGSFVSEDGLVFTNHHCARGALDAVSKPGEALADNGFFAPTLADERKVPNFFVDQLVLIKDVNDEVQRAFEGGRTEDERVTNRDKAIADIEKRYRDETKLQCNVLNFYNGGKFSLYGFKRYRDVRLVFAPELQMGFFGGDYDNFTYPRYDLDISFFRVYGDDGKPLKTPNYFRWSKAGAAENEPVFVVGNPGRTNRLFTYSQLEFRRDYTAPFTLKLLDDMVRIYSNYIATHPDQRLTYMTQLFSFSNSQKLYDGQVKGLHDPVMMAKKRDFERTFKKAVLGDPRLSSQVGTTWDEIAAIQAEKGKIFHEVQSYTFVGIGRSAYFVLASRLVDFANQMKMPEEKRNAMLRGAMLDSTKQRLYIAIDRALEQDILPVHLGVMRDGLGPNHAALNKLMGGRSPGAAAAEIIKSSLLANKDQVMQLLNGHPDNILQSDDPFITFVVSTAARSQEVRAKYSELNSREGGKVQVLGKALFGIYGTSIPPDATSSLRLADGVVKGYEYNGTIAPPFTTFYGLYDRYYSFSKKDPYAIPDRWKNPPANFNMGTPMNFATTNDIIGGNSGSPIVNKNLEIVGIVFDGNIESLPSDLIFLEESMRCIAVHSAGILEAVENIYRADRIGRELRSAKIAE